MNGKINSGTLRRLLQYFRLSEESAVAGERSALWAKIEKGIDRKRRRGKILVWNFAVAASLVAGIAGWTFYTQLGRQSIMDYAGKMTAEAQTTGNIQLVLSSEETIDLENHSQVVTSQAGTIDVNDRQVAGETSSKDDFVKLIVPKGKHTRLVLADGSSMHVNSGTTVVYPRSFSNSKKREIFVDGEIFIDVQPDKRHPFVVKTSGYDVEVLGTAFNVSAYSTDNHSEVTLVRGSVKLTDGRKDLMQLNPDQQAVVNTNGIIEKRAVDADKYIAWTDGLMIFEGEPLRYVLDRLERYYGVSITYEEDAKTRIRGSLDLNDSLDEVLDRLSVIVPMKISKSDEGYLIEKKIVDME